MSNPISMVIALGAVFSLAPFAIDMYLPALPLLAVDLGTSIDQMEATVAIFLAGYALSQLILGPLSDIFGRRKVLIVGLVVYAIGSLLCMIAGSIEQFYAFRFIQALGGGASVVVFPLVRDRFDDATGAKVISYILAIVVVAPLIAPLIGGYILIFAGWPAIFLLLTAAAVVTLAINAVVLKPIPATDTMGQVEILALACCFGPIAKY